MFHVTPGFTQRIVEEFPELISELGEHNHPPNPVRRDVKRFMNEIRDQAIGTGNSTSVIVKTCVDKLPTSCQGSVPLLRNIKRGIRRLRANAGGNPAIPHRREDINLPEYFTVTNKSEPFLFFDRGPTSDRFLIFATKDNLEFLKYCEVWLVDGTFKSSPVLFHQLFVRGHSTFPLVFMLLPKKDTNTYQSALRELVQRYPGLAPRVIMSDFELASINAFHESFPLAEQKGCFFHFSQAIFRQIQQDPVLLQKTSDDSEFSLKRRLFY
jgi:hypothetical protein